MGMKMGRSLAALSFNGGSGCYGLGSASYSLINVSASLSALCSFASLLGLEFRFRHFLFTNG